MIESVHTILAVVAIVAGAWNFMQPKGTRPHRRVGWVYAGSMVGMLATSFFIFDLFGGFGVFHVMALFSAATLALALYFPLRRHRHPGWLVHHYYWMSYSYVGLVMAGGSHLFGLVPGVPWMLRAFLFWGVPYLVGSALISRRRAAILEPLQGSLAGSP